MPTIVKIVNIETLPEVQKDIAESVNEIIDTYDDYADNNYESVVDTVYDNIYIIENRMYSESDLESFLNKNYNVIHSVALYAKKIAYQYKKLSAEKSRQIITNADSILNILERVPEQQEEEQLQQEQLPLQEPKKRGFFSRLFGKKKGGKSKRRKTKIKTKNRKIRKNASTRTRRR